jgi:hypothetical protein
MIWVASTGTFSCPLGTPIFVGTSKEGPPTSLQLRRKNPSFIETSSKRSKENKRNDYTGTRTTQVPTATHKYVY